MLSPSRKPLAQIAFAASYVLVLLDSAFSDPTPRAVPFNDTRILGPDGPWQIITTPMGVPIQYMDFYPSIDAEVSWFVAQDTCNQQSFTCLQPQPGYYDSSTWSGSRTDLNLTKSQGVFSSDDWDEATARQLNLTGGGKWFGESFTLGANTMSSIMTGNISEIVSHNSSITFPNGTSYVPISLLSLNPQTVPNPSTLNASKVGFSLLGMLDFQNNISSKSWGLHVGSGAFNITGSMYFGGYDQNRVIERPATFTNNTIELNSITLGTTSGVSPWTNGELNENFLKANGSIVDTLPATADPSVPYLYLPGDTCSALASALPVVLNTDLDLYLWDTSSTAYSDIVSSPSFLNFTFAPSSGEPISIKVPFALLNLTLDFPVVPAPTPYFPCRPSSPSIPDPWRLGRAFLQAAYIGQNNDADVFWLAQAPGPNLPTTDPVVKTIASTDRSIAQYSPGAPKWEDTWSDVLKPLTSTSPATGNSTNSPPPPATDSSLSGGAKAGIAVGVIIGVFLLALLAFLVIRHRRRQQQTPGAAANAPVPPPKDVHGMESMQPGQYNDWVYGNKTPGMAQGSHPPLSYTQPNVTHEAPHGWQPTEVPGDSVVNRPVEAP